MNTAEAIIVGLFIRNVLYGIYITILAHYLRWIFFEDEGWKLRRRINGLMLTITMLVFVSITANFGICQKLALSFIGGQETFDERLEAASYGLERVTALIIDAALVYRCWIVYSGSWRVVYFPLFLLLSNTGLFIGSFLCKAPGNIACFYDLRLSQAFYTCNIAINLYTIAAIVYQILSCIAADGNNSSGSNLYEICRILVECGLPYLFTSIFSLAIAITADESLIPTASALNSTMNGIAFNLILIRVGLHRADSGIGKWSDRWSSVSGLGFSVPEKIPPSIV